MRRKRILNVEGIYKKSLKSCTKLSRFGLFGAALVEVLFLAQSAHAATYQVGNYTITLQSTLGYTLGERTAPVNNLLASYPNAPINVDDGDKNLKSGVIANRFQTLEQLGIVDGDYGFRASAFAWLDTVYLQHSQNKSPETFNSYGIGPTGFPSGTVANEGRRIELLAAFIYGSEIIANGSQKLSWQIGRQTITWGQALYSLDGIAGLQAPVDVYEASLLANPQAQALFLPTGAAQANYDFGHGISVDGYWQFEYEPDILPGVGSYFSNEDFIGPGAQRILESAVPPGVSIYRAPDIRPANGIDQFGFSGHAAVGNFQFGAYYVRGIPKGPNVYVNAPLTPEPTSSGLKIGEYNVAYAQPVNAFAVSASTLFMSANVAAELSDRTNQPLFSEPTYTSANPASYNDPLYAIGNVVDLQLSELYASPPLPLMPNGATITSELTLNEVTNISKNRGALVPGNTSEGGSFEGTFEPNWFPRSNIEIEAPIGWTTTFLGDSQYDDSAAGTGTIDVGLEAIFNAQLSVGVNYQRYYGPLNRQGNLDRDFLTFYASRTF
jgi:hypothetical protein